MRRVFAVVAGLFAWVMLAAVPAEAGIDITVDKTTQKMVVTVDGQIRHEWPVSTGRSGYGTPTGAFRPQYLTKMHRSRKYNNAPMPHSIFFHGGYAIHATNEVGRLGRPASHGCVRLHPKHAAELYQLVKGRGATLTSIAIVATPSAQLAKAKPQTKKVELAAVDANGAVLKSDASDASRPAVKQASAKKKLAKLARSGHQAQISAARRAGVAPEMPVRVQAYDYARARFENLR